MKFGFIFVFCFGIVIIGCSKDPNATGAGLLPPGSFIGIVTDTLISSGDSVFTRAGLNGYGENVLVGKAGAVEATALINFAGEGMPDTLGSVHIDTALIQLTVEYDWNLSKAPGHYVFRKVLTSWSEGSFTEDSVARLQISPEISGLLTDTMHAGKIVSVSIDTNLIREWVSANIDTTAPLFNGIAISAMSGSPAAGIWGFASASSSSGAPLLIIKFEKNGIQDSLQFSLFGDTFFAKGPQYTAAPCIETQGAVSIRSKVNFNLTSRMKGGTINSTVLELTLNNSASSLGNGAPDSLIAFLGGDVSHPDSAFGAYYAFGYRKDTLQTQNSVYIFTGPYLSNIIQYWITGEHPDYGIVLHSASDNSSIDRLVFYSSKDPIVAHRPTMIVTYTPKK